MTQHLLYSLLQREGSSKIQYYFRGKSTRTKEETTILFEGLKSERWRIREQCAIALRLGELTTEECQLLVSMFHDEEDAVVVEILFTLMYQPSMCDFVCDFLTTHQNEILKEEKYKGGLFGSFVGSLFIGYLYEAALDCSFIDSRFCDFTDKLFREGMQLEIKNRNRIGGMCELIQYTSIMAHNRPSTIELLLYLMDLVNKSMHPRYKEYAIRSLSVTQLPTEEYKEQVYSYICKYGFWLDIPMILTFAQQFTFTETNRKSFILSVLRRHRGVSEEDHLALLELRRILQIDSGFWLEDPDICALEDTIGYSNSVFNSFLFGTNPFSYMPHRRASILDCTMVLVRVNENISKHFLIEPATDHKHDLATFEKLQQHTLKTLEKFSVLTITEHHKEQSIHVHRPLNWKTNFYYRDDSFEIGFYNGKDRFDTREKTYASYLEIAQRELRNRAFFHAESSLIFELISCLNQGDVDEIEMVWTWVEDNISPHYEYVAYLSSFALSLLDIHKPQGQRRTSIKGSVVEFIDMETELNLLFCRLLTDLSNSQDNHPVIRSELEQFFEELLEPTHTIDSSKAFYHLFSSLKALSSDVHDYWQQWFACHKKNNESVED